MTSTRWVLVTGGAQRLGRELCMAFAKAGWHVLCHHLHSHSQALHTQQSVRALGQNCELVQADLSASDAAFDVMDTCLELIGCAPTCVINNASIFQEDQALTCTSQMSLAHFQVNTLAPLQLGNALARHVTANAHAPGHHSVIHVLDQKVHNLNPDYFSYTVSKLALERAVALQAQALAPHIRVCGLSPGLMYLSGPQTQENFSQVASVNLLRHPIHPGHVAAAALALAENPCLNGCTLQADNGQHLVPLARDVMFALDSTKTP